MKIKHIRIVGAALMAVLWLGLTAFAWLKPADEFSEAERRKLDQMPTLNANTILSGSFMTNFEDYTLDQFPLRDTFRGLKSRFHYSVLNQLDNNDIYMADGYAAKLEYPLSESSVERALTVFGSVYETYLKDNGCTVFVSVVPDKGCYLAPEHGYLSIDIARLSEMMAEGMPYASFVNLYDALSIEDYYRTDTHWRQEKLLPAATVLCNALGIPAPVESDYTPVAADRAFYGVYHGQAALPMEPDTLYTMESALLDGCTVYQSITGEVSGIYAYDKLSGRDMYDVFLSGAVPIITIENPDAETDRELVIFRDSFGSSIAPLLAHGYKTVTLVDIRYISSAQLGEYVEFAGSDVLFLYSTLVLNSSNTLK